MLQIKALQPCEYILTTKMNDNYGNDLHVFKCRLVDCFKSVIPVDTKLLHINIRIILYNKIQCKYDVIMQL